MTATEMAQVATSMGGGGFAGRIALHWISSAHRERMARERAKEIEANKITADRWKILQNSMQRIAAPTMLMFAVVCCFVLLSTIILPYFAPTNVTVYLPKNLDLWVVNLEGLRKIELVAIPKAEGEAVRGVLILPVHFAMCNNVMGFWFADRGLK